MRHQTGTASHKIWDSSFHQRFKAISEIALGSIVLIALAGGIGLGAGFAWKALVADDGLRFEIVMAVGGIGLVPLLVVVAKVWEVNLSLLGNRAQAERQPTAGERIQPRGYYVRGD
jgi:hypothetical protein